MLANVNGILPVMNGATPCEGPKTLPFNLDFSQATDYEIDLTQQYQQKQFTTLQTLYAQNLSQTDDLIFTLNGTGQVISLPPNYAGFIPVVVTDPPKLTVTLLDNTITAQNVQLMNFYLPPLIWNTAP